MCSNLVTAIITKKEVVSCEPLFFCFNLSMVKLELFDTVGQEITVDKVRSFLNANKSNEIQFDISSLGGDLDSAITIYNLIKQHPKKTIAHIVGLTASAGTVIADACDEVQISDNALFLVHNGWKETTGNVFDMQKAATDLMKTDAIMIKIYREKTGLSDAKIKDLMKASDWLSPQEALQLGFVDRITETGIKIAASVILSEARKAKVNELLITKLQEKMLKNPFKSTKAKADVLNVLALKDDKQCLMNAEEVGVGVELAPLGAMTLEDGEYELADGRKITIAGGVVTEVSDPAAVVEGEATTAEVVAAVSALFLAETEKIRAEFKAELGKIKSTHVPPKGTLQAGKAMIDKPDVSEKVKAQTDAIFAEIEKNRKA